MDRVEPLARFSLGGAGAISPTVRIDRQRRREDDEREKGRKDEHDGDEAGREDEPRDGRPHVDVLA